MNTVVDGKEPNLKKLSTMTLLILNYSYLKCDDFRFDEDIYDYEFSFKV